MKNLFDRFSAYVSKLTLQVIMIVGLIHGLIYVATIPPWWNYDEAGHFEYAWLVANRASWPQRGDYDNALRLQIAEASIRNGMQSPFNYEEAKRFDDPIGIGIAQVGDLPVYYAFASLPLRLLSGADVLVQMYTARLLSVGLLLIVLWCAWHTVAELFPEQRTLAWMVTLFLALLPGLINTMGSINNDAAAAAVGALYLWTSARVLKRGFSIPNLAGWFIVIGLCLFTRDITRMLLLSTPFVLWGWVVNRKLFLAPILAGIVILLVAVPFSLSKTDAQYWFHIPAGATPNRIENSQTPFGKYALVADGPAYEFGQALPYRTIKSLRNEKLTLGVWMWADQPVEVTSPVFNFVFPYYMTHQYLSQTVRLGTAPQFYTFQVTVPYETLSILIRVPPVEAGTRIYYDGWVLTQGEFSTTPPTFNDNTLVGGTWDGQLFTNFLRNPSLESTWFNVKPWVDQKTQKVPFLQGRVSLLLTSAADPQAFGWYYRQTIANLLQTFWGKPAAAQVTLPGIYTYDVLQGLLIVALLGLGILAYRVRNWDWQTLIFLGVVMVVIWGVTVLRGAPEVLRMGTVPWARYALPAFIPTALLLCAGWRQASTLLEGYVNYPGLGTRLFIAFMAGFAVFVVFTAGASFFPLVLGLQQLVILAALTVTGWWVLERFAA